MSSPSVPQSLPMDLDDPAVQEALLLANLNGVISGFTSALALAGELRLPLDDLLIGPETPAGGTA